MREIISQTNDGVTIQVTTEAPKNFFQFLEKTAWGTDGMLYIMNDLEPEVTSLPEPYYVTLCENDEIIATMLFSKKTVMNLGRPFDVYYAALLSVRPDKQSHGYGSRLVTEATHFFLTTYKKCFVYAHVEEENEPSQKVFQKAGFQVIGSFTVPVFSRLSPKPDPRVSRLEPEQGPEMLNLLKDHYKDFGLVDLDLSFDPQSYYILRENQTIIAGLQFHPFHWTVTNIQGLGGQAALKLLPKTPVLRHLINFAHYRFLKIGNIYTVQGHEDALGPLMQTMLYDNRLKSGIAYMNTRHPNLPNILKPIKTGLLSPIATKAFIYAYPQGLNDEDYTHLQSLPLNISMLDSI